MPSSVGVVSPAAIEESALAKLGSDAPDRRGGILTIETVFALRAGDALLRRKFCDGIMGFGSREDREGLTPEEGSGGGGGGREFGKERER